MGARMVMVGWGRRKGGAHGGGIGNGWWVMCSVRRGMYGDGVYGGVWYDSGAV